jgi:toxin ParE1/3/4
MSRRVVFGPLAQADLDDLYDWISDRVGTRTAQGYLNRIRLRCERLDLFPERGTMRDDLAPGMRTFGIDRRVLVVFKAFPEEVVIVRVLYGGRNVEAIFSDEPDGGAP